MNISLAGASKKKKKRSIGYGLNQRGKSGQNISDAFEGSSSSEDEDHPSSNHRARVNQQLSKEQDALRKRAQTAASTVDASVYDYDGAYDSFQPAATIADNSKGTEERKSRYIGDLLKAAKKRERERDAVYERKVAKEQAEEDLQADYQGKEKFVTRAYKRKLEERKQWEMEEKRQEDEEQQNDVTKKVDGTAFASFYGNFNRNVAVVGGDDGLDDPTRKPENSSDKHAISQIPEHGDVKKRNLGFVDGFQRGGTASTSTHKDGNADQQVEEGPNGSKIVSALSHRERREKKVAQARRRYLDRKAAAAVQ